MSFFGSNRVFLSGSVSIIALALGAPVTFANPTGGTIESGQAEIQVPADGNLLITQSSPKAVINWENFDIGIGEITTFALPSWDSVTLNRDFSGDPSTILGSLNSNGRLYLVNPSGILFGAGASVDVAGLVATTHNISTDNFLNDRLRFTIAGNERASVINNGQVTVDDLGFAAFVAPHLRNDGAIIAHMGRVDLASANGFALDLYGDRLISFFVENPNSQQMLDENGDPISALVENHGSITADGGQVFLTASAARGIVDSVINTDGIIQANTVEKRGGKIVLGGGSSGTVRISGSVKARGNSQGDKGGEIIVTGDILTADQHAIMDVSGWVGGGKLLFGGDYLGGNVSASEAAQNGFSLEHDVIATSRNVNVVSGAKFAADALHDGDGGKVIVWADDYTTFDGTITARGGVGAGNGGAVETSGKLGLQVGGSVDASAQNGVNGVWLLDPTSDVRIVGNSTPQSVGVSSTSTGSTFSPLGSPSFVRASTIESAINSGTNVIVQTFRTAAEAGQGAIYLDNSITKSAGGNAKLTFNANSGFYAKPGAIIRSTSGKLDIGIDADTDNQNGGIIDIAGGNSYAIQTNGGNVDMRAWDFRLLGRVVDTNGGNVSLRHIDANTTWMTIAGAIGTAFVIDAKTGDVRLDTNFVAGDLGNRIEIGNYAVRGGRITIDAAAVTNIGTGFNYENSEYQYTTTGFNNDDGIGELFYRTISYLGGAVPGTIDGSVISASTFAAIQQVFMATIKPNVSLQTAGALGAIPKAQVSAAPLPSIGAPKLVTPNLSSFAKSYLNAGLDAVGAASLNAAKRIYNSQSIEDRLMPLGWSELIVSYNSSDPKSIYTLVQDTKFQTGLHRLAVANLFTSVGKANEVYQAVSSLIGIPSDLLSVAKLLPSAANGISGMSGLELITLINALSEYAINPITAAQGISDSISVVDAASKTALATAARGTRTERQAGGMMVSYLHDIAIQKLVTSNAGLDLLVAQIVIDKSVLANPTLRADPKFLAQVVSVPSKLFGIIPITRLVPLSSAIESGYLRLP